MVTLVAKKRKEKQNMEEMRKAGEIPAVYYGFKQNSTPISVLSKDFIKVWKQAGESSTIILDADGEKIDALIHDVQMNPVKDIPIHVDFLVVDANKEIEVKVAIEFIGESPAVKGGVGMLLKVMHELEVRALPKNLPHAISVDLSGLANLHDQIHIKDIKLPSGVTAITNADEVIAAIAQMKEEVEEVVAEVDLSTIGLSVEKGKEAAEEGAEGEAAPKEE